MEADEQETITEHRWWSAAELDASDEQIFPEDLAALLRRHTAVRADPLGEGGR
jgi:hypothetical protein